MTAILIQFTLAGLTIIIAGIILTKAADDIARKSGLGGLLIGSVFLAAATSLPELMVNVSAVKQKMPDLAIGNLFGSSLFNLLILAICDLLHQERGRLFSRASVAHALSATQSMTMTALAGIGIILSPKLSEYAFGGLSYGTLFILLAYILGMRLVFQDQRVTIKIDESVEVPPKRKSLSAFGRPFLGYLAAAAIILLAAPFFAEAAGDIADKTGLGKTFIGTTLVALCTSLPELVASLAAVRMGAFDLALGNIFGSNTFNMVLLVPLDFVNEGPILASVSSTHIFTCFAAIVVTAVAVMGQLYQVERRKMLMEPDAMLIIVLVSSALWAVYFLG